MAWLEGWRCQGPGRKGRSFVKQISKVTLQRNLFVHTLCVLHIGSVTHCLNFLHFKNHCRYDTVAENVGCKQITVSVMWTASASPSGISLENHVWSWVCGRSTTTTPTLKFPLLVLVRAQRTTSWWGERDRRRRLLQLEKGLHNLNFSLTTVLRH